MARRQPTADLEWYPVGRILLWVAGFAVLTTMAALLTLGTDADTINSALRRGLLQHLERADAAQAAISNGRRCDRGRRARRGRHRSP